MAKPEIILIGGHAYRGQEICQLCRHQLEEWKAVQPRQLAPLELKDDRHPATERNSRPSLCRVDLFRGHARAPRKRGMIANSLPTRPTTHCPLHALARPAVRPRSDVSTWAKSVGRSFSDDPFDLQAT